MNVFENILCGVCKRFHECGDCNTCPFCSFFAKQKDEKLKKDVEAKLARLQDFPADGTDL